MTSPDDSTSDMANRSTSEVSDRLLSGSAQLGPDAKLPEVARLLTALRSPAPTDGQLEQEAVTAFVAAVAAAPTRLDDVRRSRRRRSVVVAAAAVSLVVGGTAAAAATGSLPSGAQSAVSQALSHVNVHVPDPVAHGGTHVSVHGADHHTPVGPDATGNAEHGLCTAWAAHDAHDTTPGHSGDATAFANLRHAAHDQGMTVADFCAPVLDPVTAPATTPGQSAGDHGQAGQGQSDQGNGQSGESHGRPGQGQSGDAHGGSGSGTDVGNGAHDTGAGPAAGAASGGSSNGKGGGRSTP